MKLFLQFVRYDHRYWEEDEQRILFTIEGDVMYLDVYDSKTDYWMIEPLTKPEVIIIIIMLWHILHFNSNTCHVDFPDCKKACPTDVQRTEKMFSEMFLHVAMDWE